MMVATVLYVLAMCGTTAYHAVDFDDAEDAAWDANKDGLPWQHHAAGLLWAFVCSCLWPFYWTGRLLYAIPERLMLPPGEGL